MSRDRRVPFTKMTGTGNDFILFDNREGIFSGREKAFFSRICQRRLSIGADGVLLLEKEGRKEGRKPKDMPGNEDSETAEILELSISDLACPMPLVGDEGLEPPTSSV